VNAAHTAVSALLTFNQKSIGKSAISAHSANQKTQRFRSNISVKRICEENS